MSYLRTWGRIYNEDGSYQWVKVETDDNGNNDLVYVTTLAQVLQLNLYESPFYSAYGIPAHQTIVTQIYPDFYLAQTQRQFSGFFASLTIKRVAPTPALTGRAAPSPTYQVNVITHAGATLEPITVPTSIPT